MARATLMVIGAIEIAYGDVGSKPSPHDWTNPCAPSA
jgi:hypothetical protein